MTQEDQALHKYLELKATPPIDATGMPNFDYANKQADAYLAQYPADVQNYVKRNEMRWLNDMPEVVKKVEQMRAEALGLITEAKFWVAPTDIRSNIREQRPDIDAALNFWQFGGISTCKTEAAQIVLKKLADELGRPYLSIPGLVNEVIAEAEEPTTEFDELRGRTIK